MKLFSGAFVLFVASWPSIGSAQTLGPAITNWFLNTQRATSALAVSTKQTSVSAEQVAASDTSMFKAFAQTIAEVESNLSIVTAQNVYSAPVVNGSTMCDVVRTGADHNAATDLASTVREGFDAASTDWQQNGGDAADQFQLQLEMRQQVFCSRAEFEAGLCGPGSYNEAGGAPAGDTNAAEWLLRRSYGSGEALVGSVYIDTVAPFPTMYPPDVADNDVSRRISNLRAAQEMARYSIVRQSLADVLSRGLEGGE